MGAPETEEVSVGPGHTRRSASVAGSVMIPFGFMSRLSSRRVKKKKDKAAKKAKRKNSAEQYDNNAHEIEEIGVNATNGQTPVGHRKSADQQQTVPMIKTHFKEVELEEEEEIRPSRGERKPEVIPATNLNEQIAISHELPTFLCIVFVTSYREIT